MKFIFFARKQKNKTEQKEKVKFSTERKQKIFAAAIFGVFFIGLAYLCVQEFPDINRGASEYQDEENFAVKISTADSNKAAARNSKRSGIDVSSFDLSVKIQNVTDAMSKQISSLLPTIGIAHLSSVYQTDNCPRIIVDSNHRFVNIPQWNDAESKSNAVINLAKLANKEDSAFFFVQMPSELSNSPDLPLGMFDNCTPQIDSLIDKLSKSNEDKINILDLRFDKQFKNKQITFSNDALILPEISQMAAEATVKETAKHLSASSTDFSYMPKFKRNKLKKHFIGEFTASLGEQIVPKSDFNVILPVNSGKYEVNVFDDNNRKANSSNTYTGTIKESVMDYSLFATYATCPYGYLRQGKFCVDINNLSDEIDNDFRALIITDKQGLAFTSFFSQYIKHTTFVDASSIFLGRIPNLIKKGKYDAVYCVVADTSYANGNFWKFDKNNDDEADKG